MRNRQVIAPQIQSPSRQVDNQTEIHPEEKMKPAWALRFLDKEIKLTQDLDADQNTGYEVNPTHMNKERCNQRQGDVGQAPDRDLLEGHALAVFDGKRRESPLGVVVFVSEGESPEVGHLPVKEDEKEIKPRRREYLTSRGGVAH